MTQTDLSFGPGSLDSRAVCPSGMLTRLGGSTSLWDLLVYRCAGLVDRRLLEAPTFLQVDARTHRNSPQAWVSGFCLTSQRQRCRSLYCLGGRGKLG